VTRNDYFLLISSAFCLILAWPPLSLGFLAGVGLIPLFLFIRGKSLKTALTGGLFTGVIVAAGTVYWLSWATIPGFIGSLVVVAPYYGLFCLFMAFLYQRWGKYAFLATPFVWAGIEVFSTWGELAFPWNLLGYTFSNYHELIQIASWSGIFGVGFWIVVLNVIIFFLLESKSVKTRIIFSSIAIAFVAITWVSGHQVITNGGSAERKVKVSIVQGNMDPYQEWTKAFVDSNFAVYDRLNQSTASFNPDLIIWPESAAPCFLRFRSHYAQPIRKRLKELDAALVIGSSDYDYQTRDQFNCSFLVRHDTYELKAYYKRRLVPFSERVPLASIFPGAFKYTKKIFLTVGNFTPGKKPVLFTSWASSLQDSIRYSPVICFDSVFPIIVSDAVRTGAQILIIQTNDGWFGKTSGPYQHARLAAFRAIENRVWVARSANTGISEFIDPWGRIVKSTNLYEEDVINQEVSLREGNSFFLQHGRTITWFIIFINIAIFLAASIKPKRVKS